MLFQVEFDDTQIQDFLLVIEQTGELALSLAGEAMQEALQWLLEQLPPDPTRPIPEGAPSPLRTAKQKRWFWANLKAGNIPGWSYIAADDIRRYAVPKSGELRDAFHVEVTQTPYEVFGSIGTDLAWAPWVVGSSYPGSTFEGKQMYQAPIHAYDNRWWRFEEVMKANEQEFLWILQDIFWDKFREAYGRKSAGKQWGSVL